MDLVIKRDTVIERIEFENNDFKGKDGVYKNIILSSQDKVGDMDFNRGQKFLNMRVEFGDGRTKWLNIKYKEADTVKNGTTFEGDYVQSGVNFVTALRDILIQKYEEEGRPTSKFDAINGALIVKEFVDKKIPIYLSYYNSERNDKTYFNLSTFFSPVGTEEEAREKAEERELEFIVVEPEEGTEKKTVEKELTEPDYEEETPWEEEDDDWDDWEDEL